MNYKAIEQSSFTIETEPCRNLPNRLMTTFHFKTAGVTSFDMTILHDEDGSIPVQSVFGLVSQVEKHIGGKK